jgi:nucleoid DNA-binding protein
MFRLSEDLMIELCNKYPESNVRRIVHDVFDSILEKTLKDGSCKVIQFGKFECYKTVSAKLAKEVIRFKFKISQMLEKKIKFDTYLLNNTPIKSKVPFTDENLEKCNRDIRDMNIEAAKNASKMGSIRSKEKEMSQIITDILNS